MLWINPKVSMIWFSYMKRKSLDFPQQKAKTLLCGYLANCFNCNILKKWGELWEKSSVNNMVIRHLILTFYLHSSAQQLWETSAQLLFKLCSHFLLGSHLPEKEGGQNICYCRFSPVKTFCAVVRPVGHFQAVSRVRPGKRLRRKTRPSPRGSCGALPTRWQAVMLFAFSSQCSTGNSFPSQMTAAPGSGGDICFTLWYTLINH